MKAWKNVLGSCLAVGLLLSALTNMTYGQEATEVKTEGVDQVLFSQTVDAGVQYLIAKGQDPVDGSYSKALGPAVTAMCTTALLRNGVSAKHPAVVKGLKNLMGFVHRDGGVYAKGSNLRNYETSVAVMCFTEANTDGQYDQLIEGAIGFLKGLQWDGGEGHTRTDPFFGGQGYGSHKRPDLSNTSYFMDALKAASEDPDSVTIQNALIFVSRAQNLSSDDNKLDFALEATADDRGGFIYTPVGPETKVEEKEKTEGGGLRSYASMTYAGLKSLLHAGLKKDDIRVKAALDWISRHYDLTTNPGMGAQGLFYYYHVFAKTLDVNGSRLIVDQEKKAHNWRADLVKELNKRQRNDGSWVNEADRWYEGDPNLVTSYALLALSYCHPDKDK